MKPFLACTIVAGTLYLALAPAHAWDGYDYKNGTFVEVDKGNLVRPGEQIEFYDYKNGGYRTMDVEDVYKFGSSVTVEGIDRETGERREFEMDKD